jgi:hypothetical protein
MATLFPKLGEAPGHDFETQRAEPLPKGLQGGPIPDLQSRRNSGVVGVQSAALGNGLPEPYRSLLYGIQRKGEYVPIVGVVGTVAILARPREERTYLIVQNTSVANTLFVGVGYAPANTGTGITGLILAANGGNYEPAVIPQGDIWLLGSAANTQFVVYIAQG